MKNRPRPHVSFAIRVQVAERQLVERGIWKSWHVTMMQGSPTPASRRLAHALELLFGTEPRHLDHNPPLRVRTYNPRIKNIAARYKPNANDPAHLIYRNGHAHHIKTNVRGDGAQFPDRVLIKRERRRERGASDSRPKARMPKRKPWPKGRKLQGRGFKKRAGFPKSNRPRGPVVPCQVGRPANLSRPNPSQD